MMDVVFTGQSEADLDNISEYIACHSKERALSFVGELTEAALNRGTFPYSGRHRPDVKEDLYTFPYGRYIIVYSVNQDHVLINRIIHSSRDINHVLRRKERIT